MRCSLKLFLLIASLLVSLAAGAATKESPANGHASWYGEELRGKLMANGKRFDPRKMTAASWFYPLGTKVRVTLRDPAYSRDHAYHSVIVTITDRGPALDLVRNGRIIDLGQAAFEKLAAPELGLIPIQVRPLE
jgi:rare lipoprotein A